MRSKAGCVYLFADEVAVCAKVIRATISDDGEDIIVEFDTGAKQSVPFDVLGWYMNYS